MKKCHSNTGWNDKAKSILCRTDFEGFFIMLDSNSLDNRIIFVLQRLDKSGLYDQLNELKVVYNCKFQYYELCKILKPSDEELSDFLKGIMINIIIISKLDCHVIFFIHINILMI